MAKQSSDKTYVTVEKGDTLSQIALTYLGSASKYKQLAAINGISNPNLISIGQKIYLSSTSSSSSSSTSTTNSNQPVISNFGIQSNSDNTIFATWTWSKSNTDNYRTMWYYATGDGVWFVGSDSTTTYKQSTYSIPSNAKKIKFKVKPISKTKTVNNKETYYWTANWSTDKIYTVSNPPETPSVPTVEITNKNKLTASVDNIESGVTQVQFYFVKNNKYSAVSSNPVTATVTKQYASCKITVDAGGEYKVKCRAVKNKLYSEWSDYSSNVASYPSAPDSIETLKTLSDTSVYISWTKVSTAESYTVEYTEKKAYFTSSPSNVSSVTVKSTVKHAEITGMESGKEYFFRVCATNTQGDSSWTEVKSIVVGKKPSAPTTWSSTTTAIVGEKLYLYWVHNSEDGSSQTYANLELTTVVGETSTTTTVSVKNSTDEDEKDKTSVYEIDTSSYEEGAVIKWRVQTKGVHADYSEWSALRSIDIYANPTLSLSVTDVNGDMLETLTSFPFYIAAIPSPNTQAPIGYHVEIIANESYETIDNVGNQLIVSVGDSVYSNFFDISYQTLALELSANHLDLENGVSYTVKCIVSMNSGLTAEASTEFTVSWMDEIYSPNARISIDSDKLTASINPYCEQREITYHKVTLSSGVYTKSSATLNKVYGELVENAITTTGENVYYGSDANGNDTYYCEVETATEIEDVTLSVYRREYDGRFVEIQTGIANGTTFVVDPHPALDYARYRIVAISNETGAVSYYDMPGEPVGESAVIVQWAEQWTSFNTLNEDELAEPEHTASMLKLPYNIDVSDSNSPDVSLVEYIGRSHPVSYYGTQLGETATWNVEIPKDDKETLYALRRLKIWMGDVYVREPSGSGYWANVKVKFDQKHCDLTIPVTLDITRVEGGK